MIKEIKTNHPFVCRFDDVLTLEQCVYIENYVKNKLPLHSNVEENIRPWAENQNIKYSEIDDINVKKLLNCYRFLTTQFILYYFNHFTYPNLTDLVLWQEGRSFGYHWDNGGNFKELESLKTRSYSSVLYINDDYEGGETVVKGYEGSPDYISKPQRGSVIVFTGDERSIHKVNKILKSNRVTVASWYTLEKQDIEI